MGDQHSAPWGALSAGLGWRWGMGAGWEALDKGASSRVWAWETELSSSSLPEAWELAGHPEW
jgi:hypothetical protein